MAVVCTYKPQFDKTEVFTGSNLDISYNLLKIETFFFTILHLIDSSANIFKKN